MTQILGALSMLAAVLLVLVGAYCFTRWAGKNLGGGLVGICGGGWIEVLDRANLARDQSLLVVRAGERYLLLGSTPGGLTLLAELTREEGEHWKPPAPQTAEGGKCPPDFRAVIRQLKKK